MPALLEEFYPEAETGHADNTPRATLPGKTGLREKLEQQSARIASN